MPNVRCNNNIHSSSLFWRSILFNLTVNLNVLRLFPLSNYTKKEPHGGFHPLKKSANPKLFTFQHFRRFLLLCHSFPHGVRLLVEMLEQPEQSNDVNPVEPSEHALRVLGDGNQIGTVEEDQDELVHLHPRQVLLPPQILLHVRAKRGQHVIRIHDGVDEAIEQGPEITQSPGHEFQQAPLEDQHGDVMVHVEERDLVVLLSHHEEEGVEEFDVLGHKVPPVSSDQPHRCRSPIVLVLLLME